MENKENTIYTYTQKIISQVVSNNDKETIKAITRYCEENNVYPNLISEERLKEVIELGLKSEQLQQELSIANDKLKKIEEYIKEKSYYTEKITDEESIAYGEELMMYSFSEENMEELLEIIKGDEEE